MTTTTGRKPRYFYGWNIVAAAFLANLSYAEQYSSMLGFFIKPLQNEFGWSRSILAAVQTIARVTEAAFAPVVGPLVDRYGPRVLMLIGAVVVGFTMLAITRVNAVWQFYLLRGVLEAVAFALMGQVVTSVAISKWFVQKRGRAIAISQMGNQLSKVIFVPVTVFVIAASGWRTMFVIFGIVTWLVVLIPSAILMRRRPEDMGLHPDGIEPGTDGARSNEEKQGFPASEVTSVQEPIWNRREVLKTGAFWLLAFCFGVNNMALQGINISLAPYIQDLGYGEAMLASVMTFLPAVATVSLPAMGFLAEHSQRVGVRVIPFVMQGIAVFFLISARQPVFLWLAVAIWGIGNSGATVIQEVIWANYFGRPSLGLVRSLGFLAIFMFGASGPVAMNIVYDVKGSYQPAFIVIIGLFIISTFIMWVLQPPKAHRFATAAEMTPPAGQHQLH